MQLLRIKRVKIHKSICRAHALHWHNREKKSIIIQSLTCLQYGETISCFSTPYTSSNYVSAIWQSDRCFLGFYVFQFSFFLFYVNPNWLKSYASRVQSIATACEIVVNLDKHCFMTSYVFSLWRMHHEAGWIHDGAQKIVITIPKWNTSWGNLILEQFCKAWVTHALNDSFQHYYFSFNIRFMQST